jgi:hypothetical protein
MHRWQLLLQQQWHVQMGQNLRQLWLAQLQLMDQNLGQLWLMQLQLMPQSDGACAVSSQPGTGF